MSDFLVADLSRHNGEIDFKKMKTAGVRAVITRATVGDYYVDTRLYDNVRGAQTAGLLVGVYYVIAPGDGYGRRISAIEHMVAFQQAINGLKLDLPHTVDCELTRGEDSHYITSLIERCLEQTPNVNAVLPSIYTRQTWWDVNVRASSQWGQYRLHAARYQVGLSSPWADSKYRFRDWQNWYMHQFTADGNGLGPRYGCTGSSVDLNRVNGDWTIFLEANGLAQRVDPAPDPITINDRVNRLEAQLTGLVGELVAKGYVDGNFT